MKKFFSLIAAVLLAGSMMAVTLDPATQTPVSADGKSEGVPVSVTINGIEVSYQGALNAASDYGPADFRVYANQTLTLSASSNITKVVIAGKANKAGFTLSSNKGNVTTGASYADITEKATLADPLVVVEDINSKSVSLTVSKQMRAYMIEVTLGEGGGDDPGEGGEGGEGTNIDVEYAEAAYITDESDGDYWQVNLYKDYDEETEIITYPDFYVLFAPKSKTAIAGTYAANDITIYLDTDEETEIEAVSSSDLKITLVEGTTYRYELTFVGDDDNEYILDVSLDTYAYDYSSKEEITLDETGGGDITPSGDVITCAEAAELALGGSTATVTIEGYVTEYVEVWSSHKNISFWMADSKDGGKVFEAFRVNCENEADAPKVGDKVRVTGQLTKYTKNDVTIAETKQGGTFVIVEKGEGGDITPVGDVITCAEAAELALGGSTATVTIEGYVTEYVEVWSSHKNISFWMADSKDGGKVFEAFRVNCENEADAPKVGDKVRVTGKLTKYTKGDQTIAETEKGGSFVIVEKGEGGDITPVGDVITCAEAAELALGGSTATVTIEGFVTEYVSEWSEQYKNISFWMADTKDGGQVFQAFRVKCETADLAPAVGAKVRVTGQLTKYTKDDKTIAETKQGGSFVIVDDTPVDNVMINAKGVKTIENGMLIIELNGVRYNVVGQIVR